MDGTEDGLAFLALGLWLGHGTHVLGVLLVEAADPPVEPVVDPILAALHIEA